MLLLQFHLGDQRFAAPTHDLVEILPLARLQELRGVPACVAGLLNYRARPTPVVDLSRLVLGRSSHEQLSTRILIFERPRVGVIVEVATDTLRVSADEIELSPLEDGASPWFTGVLTDSTELIQIFDPTGLAALGDLTTAAESDCVEGGAPR